MAPAKSQIGIDAIRKAGWRLLPFVMPARIVAFTSLPGAAALRIHHETDLAAIGMAGCLAVLLPDSGQPV